MRSLHSLWILVLAVLFAWSPVDANAQASCSPSVTTAAGVTLCGFVDTRSDGTQANAFLGLRYATGQRWGSSTLYAYPPSTSPVQAKAAGPICPQPTFGAPPKGSCPQSCNCPSPCGCSSSTTCDCAQATAVLPSGQSEDCYFLNVWAPISPPAPPLPGSGYPVMVFIHGGAFTLGKGSAPMYDGAHLAARGVVVVSFNYRLGAMGFLELASFTDQGQNNFGFRDQLIALAWVQENIARFGGDPTRVTIFGESAGAMSVGLHALFTLSQPPYKNYFQAAIMESNPLGLSYKTQPQAQQMGTQLAQQAGCTQADPTACLQAKPACSLVNAETAVLEGTLKAFSSQLAWAPFVDGSLIQKQPMDAAKSGGFTVPVILGTNENEGTLFSALYLDLNVGASVGHKVYTEALNSLFNGQAATIQSQALYKCAAWSLSCRTQLDAALTAGLFSCPNRELAQLAKGTTYAYLFAEVNPACNSWGLISPACGKQVCHGAELPYVFTTPESICGCTFPPNSEYSPISQAMGDSWASFASTGAPKATAAGWPSWSPFSPAKNYLIFDGSPSAMAVDPFEGATYGSLCDELWKTIGYGAPGQWERLLTAKKRR